MKIQVNNSFLPCYSIDEQGHVFNGDNEVSPDGQYSVRLKTIDGITKKISIFKLYELVFNKYFAIDTINNLPGEEWREIANTRGAYYISNLGRCKSYKGQQAQLLKPYITPKGYEKIEIKVNGARVNKFVHFFVARAFLGEPENEYMQIHHKDFTKRNNANNLEYLTAKDHVKKHQERRKLENSTKSANIDHTETTNR